MKEIYTLFYNNNIIKYEQCFLFYDENVLRKFAETMEKQNKYCSVYVRYDKTLFLIVDYGTTESYKKGKTIIESFARNYHIENTSAKTRMRTPRYTLTPKTKQTKKGNN